MQTLEKLDVKNGLLTAADVLAAESSRFVAGAIAIEPQSTPQRSSARSHYATHTRPLNISMSATPLHDIWDAAASQPFTPGVSKEAQFQIGFTLLLFAVICSGVFGLSKSLPPTDPIALVEC